MGSIGKAFSFLLVVILAVSTSFMIQATLGQVGVTNPSTPGFDVTLQTYNNYIPPTYGVDPQTGKAIITKEGYTEIQKWVRIETGGQPFLRYNNSEGQLISLFYNVRWMGDHDTTWQYIPQDIHYGDATEPWDTQAIGRLISLGFKGIPNGGVVSGWMNLLDPTNRQIDFQVQAMIGYYNSNNDFIGQRSDWSNTQTLNLADGSVSVSTSPTPTPTVPEFPLLAIIALFSAITLTSVLMLRLRKR